MKILSIRAKKPSLKQHIWVISAYFCSYQFQKHENQKNYVRIFKIHMLESLPASFMKHFLDYSLKKAKNSEKGLFYSIFLMFSVCFCKKFLFTNFR